MGCRDIFYKVKYIIVKEFSYKKITNLYVEFKKFEKPLNISREELKEHQNKCVKLLVKTAYTSTSYYNKLFKEMSMKPEDIRTIEDFKKLPVITRDIAQNYIADMVRTDIKGKCFKMYTSGTTNKRMYIKRNIHDTFTTILLSRIFLEAGINRDDCICFLFPKESSSWKGRMILNLFYPNFIFITPKDLQNELKKGNRRFLSKIDGIFTYTRLLSAIAARYPEEIKMLKPKGIVLSGEILNKAIENCYKKFFPDSQIIDTYSCIELGWISMMCPEGHMHVMEDFYLPKLEFVNERQAKLYLTFLKPMTTMLLNYDTGDLIEVIKDCQCGYSGMGFKFIKRHTEGELLKGITKKDILDCIDKSQMVYKYLKIENISIKVEYKELKTVFYIMAEALEEINDEVKEDIIMEIRRNIAIYFAKGYTFKENLWDVGLRILKIGKFPDMSGKVKLE